MTGSAGGLFLSDGRVGADLARVDWAATALGPVEGWPQSLTSAVSTVLRSRFSMWMAWGPELTFFCNEAYRRETLGAKYPWALGRPASEVWSEIWEVIGPRIEGVISTGDASWDEALLLFLERSGYREETYHTFSYSPLTAEDGSVAGMLCVVIEDTERVIGARRMSTLRTLGAELVAAGTDHDVLHSAAATLAANPRDIPFSLLYTLDADRGVATLEAMSGLGAGHPGAPASLHIADPEIPWPLGGGAAGRPVIVSGLEARLGVLPRGEWDEPPEQAMVLELVQPGRAQPAGFLVVGLNRYRPLDDGYRSFLDLVAGQVASRLATARAYEAERVRAEQLAELDRAKTAFFTNVSHEFRTPLTLLLGPVEDALADIETPLNPRQRRWAEVVQRNAERLLNLVNTLLDFSRLESGRTEPRFEATDLARYTTELASAFASAVERAGLAFDVDCRPLPEPVWVDRDLWAKVVFNLLSNALKFTFDGGITVRLRAEATGVELEVIDTGVGIAPDEQARLFERFYRASPTRARTHEGSGIGLALVAELAALHGGKAAVVSALGAGSTFSVTLPFGDAHLLPEHRVASSGDPAELAGHDGGGTRPTDALLAEVGRWVGAESPGGAIHQDIDGDRRPCIVVIDDNDDMRTYISRLLGRDYAVRSAADGLQGVDLVRRLLPDLVISDVMMPGLDGFGVLKTLRGEVKTEHIPVMLLSARAGEESTVEGLDAGADDYLVKPFTARELLARVRANLKLDSVRRVRDRLARSQALLDQSQRIARIGSWEIDVASGAIEGSDELIRQLQMSASELRSAGLDGALDQRVHRDDQVPLRAAISRLLTDGGTLDQDVRIVTPDGSERVYRALGEVIEEEGRLRLRGANQDITDQRSSERVVAAALAAREVAAREHRIADELQQSLLPALSFDPDGLSIATYYRAGVEGTQVGGDWYDVIDLGAGRTALVLGDVMGRGVRAAAVMGQLRAAIRAYARLDLLPDHVLELLDASVRSLGEDQIVTCVYAVYDPTDLTLCYANAGHMPPILAAPGRPTRRLVGASGPPLGIGPLTSGSHTVTLPPGGTLLLYTDGLVERRGSNVEEGIDRLAEVVAGAEGTISGLPGLLVDRLLPDGPDDDVAVLAARTTSTPHVYRSASFPVAFRSSEVRTARRALEDTLGDWGVSRSAADSAVLAASEMITNAIVHGRAPVQVHLRLTSTNLILQVLDGAPSPPRRLRPTIDDEHGRGLLIIDSLSARWGIRPTLSGKAVWCLLPVQGLPGDDAH